MTRLVSGFVVSIVLGLAMVSGVGAQEPDIQIAQLECSGDPELVVIENLGDAPQELAGWALRSEPPDVEVFDLGVLGSLAPGASISLQSGPSAAGSSALSTEFIYRDDDPTDYARIVSDTGAVIHQVNCAASPAPTPEPSPETPAPVADVPNGGGAPPLSGSALSPLLLTLVGGSMVVAGVATLALSQPGVPLARLVGRGAPVDLDGIAAAFRQRDQAGRKGHAREKLSVPLFDIRVAAGTAIGLMIVLLTSIGWRRSG